MLIIDYKINSRVMEINYTIFFNFSQSNFLVINNSDFMNKMFIIINNTIIQIVNIFNKIVYLSYYFD